MNNSNSNSSGDGNSLVQTSTSTTSSSGHRRKVQAAPVVLPGPRRYWHGRYRYRLYCCVIGAILVMLLLVLPVRYEQAQMQVVFSSITKQQQSQPRYYQQEEDAPASSMAVVHVLFGLSGNAPGFLAEFEVALKSVVLNAPLDRALTISIMADQQAYQALPTIFARTGLLIQAGNATNTTTTTTTTTPATLPWRTRNPITIQTYDVTSYLSDWKQRIDTVFNFTGSPYGSHTIGCFFRLFAHHVLVPQQQHADNTATAAVQHVLYLDTDVVLMANLDALWDFIPTTGGAQPIFHWGAGQCSGFLIINVPQLQLLWDLALLIPLQKISERDHHLSDQTLFVGMNETFPEKVGLLPDGWDMTVTQKWRPKYRPYAQKLPDVGMLHFNGGGSSEEAYWNKNKSFITEYPKTWGTAKYYIDLPWTWSRYQAESMIRTGHPGYRLKIRHEGGGGEKE